MLFQNCSESFRKLETNTRLRRAGRIGIGTIPVSAASLRRMKAIFPIADGSWSNGKRKSAGHRQRFSRIQPPYFSFLSGIRNGPLFITRAVPDIDAAVSSPRFLSTKYLGLLLTSA